MIELTEELGLRKKKGSTGVVLSRGSAERASGGSIAQRTAIRALAEQTSPEVDPLVQLLDVGGIVAAQDGQ